MSAPAPQELWLNHADSPALPAAIKTGGVPDDIHTGSPDLHWLASARPASPGAPGAEWLTGVERRCKRAVDVIGAAFGLLLAAPLMAAVALVIVLDSRGPVFYRTYRVGQRGKLFPFYKFRTMVCQAETLLEEVRSLNEREKILFKVAEDPRLTRMGGFLRKYSLDELPQLWNILIGDMSLVGPRPPMAAEYEQFRPEHRRRTVAPPGLTGLWQVTARTDPSFERYAGLDCEYVDRWNLWLDLKILCKTIPAVLLGTGQ